METVGNHLKSKTNNECLILAGYTHDIGKLYTQTFKEADENAHYYNHANVGTYELLCKCSLYTYFVNDIFESPMYDSDFTLEWLFYINYHMHIFNITTEKAEKKWRKIFGDEKFLNLVTLNMCDRER